MQNYNNIIRNCNINYNNNNIKVKNNITINNKGELIIQVKTIIIIIAPLILLLISTITDIKTRKIKNYTTILMILTGLLTALFFNGFNGLAISFIGMAALGLIIAIFPGFSCGGGDIKLAAGCGAWMGVYANLSYHLLSRYILWFVLISLLTTWLMTTILTIKKYGLSTVGRLIYCEIASLFKIKNNYESVPMAPFMLIAYISTIFILA